MMLKELRAIFLRVFVELSLSQILRVFLGSVPEGVCLALKGYADCGR
jgi:hypothetical protein